MHKTTEVTTKKIWCNGNDEIKHPKVYLYIISQNINCPYCNQEFILQSTEKTNESDDVSTTNPTH